MSESDQGGNPATRGFRRVWLLSVLAVLATACFACYRHESRVRWLKETFEPERIRPLAEGSFAYVFDLPEEAERQRTDPTGDIVRESGYALPHPEATEESIRAEGAGRYSIESGRVVFSSTDNTDPRTNGRTYQYRFFGHKRPLARQAWHAGFFASLAALALAVAWFWKFTLKIAWDRLRLWDARAWARGLDPLLLLVALPTVLLAVFGSQAVFFDSPGYLDPLMYVGYFLHYEEHLPLFDDYYKISRLPWIWPGVAAYRVFGPLAGSYVLHGGTLIFASCSIFLAVRDTLEDRRAAVMAAILFVSYPYALGPGGWNYHVTVTVGYYVTSLWCLTRAAREAQPNAWLLGAGAAIACAVHTHLFCVVYLPLQVLHLAVLLGRRLRLKHAFQVFCGGCLATLVFAMGNFATGGEFLFFMRQIKYTMHLSREGNFMYLPASEWLHQATWLMLPLAVAMGSCAFLLGNKHVLKAESKKTLLLVEFLMAAILHMGFQFVRSQTALQPDYMAGILHGFMFLAMGGLLGFGRIKPSISPAVLGTGAVIFCFIPIVLLSSGYSGWSGVLASLGLGAMSSILAFALLSFAALAFLPRRAGACVWTFLALWGMANFSHAQCAFIGRWGAPSFNRDLFATYLQVHKHANQFDTTLLGIKFWFDRDQILETPSGTVRIGRAYDSCLSLRGWLGNLLGGSSIPPIEALNRDHLKGVEMIGILSKVDQIGQAENKMMGRVMSLGWKVSRVGKVNVASGEIHFSVSILRLSNP